jgi:hypothetical protein
MSDTDFVDVGDLLVVRISGYPVGKARVDKVDPEGIWVVLIDVPAEIKFRLPLDVKSYDTVDGYGHHSQPLEGPVVDMLSKAAASPTIHKNRQSLTGAAHKSPYKEGAKCPTHKRVHSAHGWYVCFRHTHCWHLVPSPYPSGKGTETCCQCSQDNMESNGDTWENEGGPVWREVRDRDVLDMD